MPDFDNEFIKTALDKYEHTWKLGNKILYDLCEANPEHKKNDVIIAKFWLIGRAYAAAVERGRKPKNGAGETEEISGDNFYVSKLGPQIQSKRIDDWLSKLNRKSNRTSHDALGVHKKLVELLKDLTELEKRSLASKYLHFHFRDKFFIYDSYANASVEHLTKKFRDDHKKRNSCKCVQEIADIDRDYAKFFFHCEWLVQFIQEEYRPSFEPLDPRQLDIVLLAWYDQVVKPEAEKKRKLKNSQTRTAGKL